MNSQLTYTVFETEIGWMSVLASTGGLLGITMPCRSEEEALQRLGDTVKDAARSDAQFADLVKRFNEFFSGGTPSFPDPVDFSGATSFQKAVWEAVRQIPYGDTRSYGEIAEQIGRHGAARAVGQAMNRNPVAIIVPCHRVVAGGGKLGGFGGGEDLKRYLLDMEASTTTE